MRRQSQRARREIQHPLNAGSHKRIGHILRLIGGHGHDAQLRATAPHGLLQVRHGLHSMARHTASHHR